MKPDNLLTAKETGNQELSPSQRVEQRLQSSRFATSENLVRALVREQGTTRMPISRASASPLGTTKEWLL